MRASDGRGEAVRAAQAEPADRADRHPERSSPAAVDHDALAEERVLVAACRAGDPAAAGRFVAAFESLVYGVCVRVLGDRHEAEDVAQEVFLRAYRSLHRWDAVRPLRHWLTAIAVNRCRTALGKRKRRPVTTAVEDAPDVADHRPTDGAGEGAELAAAVAAAVAELRPEVRQAFLLYHEQGMGYEQMSQATGRPVGTLKTWLHRARAQLWKRLQEMGFALDGGSGPPGGRDG